MLFVKALFSVENPLWPVLVKFRHSCSMCWTSEKEKERILNNPSIFLFYLKNSFNNFLQKYNFIDISALIWIICLLSLRYHDCVCVCACVGGGRIFKSFSHCLKSLWNSILSIKLCALIIPPLLLPLPSLGLYQPGPFSLKSTESMTFASHYAKIAVTVYSFFSWLTFLFAYPFNCLFFIITKRHVFGLKKNLN